MSASDAAPGLTARRRPRRRGHPGRWRAEAAGLVVLSGALRALPESAALRLGRDIGGAGCWAYPRYRNTALANAEIVLPTWTEHERRDLVRASFAELGRNMTAWLRLPALPHAELADRIEWDGIAHLEKALARGRGVVGVTAHYGFWELILPAVRLRFGENAISAVEREVRNPHLRAFVGARRRLAGGTPLPQRAAPILRALRRNAGIGMLVDHYLAPHGGGALAPFFGHRAWTNPGPATLARRAGSAILPVHAETLLDGRHRIAFGPEIPVPRTTEIRADIAVATKRINAAIEARVLARPELWLWVNKRWKRSPDLPGLYKGSRS